MKNYVSEAVVRRLPRYRRYLKNLETQNIGKISSKDLGELMDVTASQIRQDLNHFGGFGQQGYGYGVTELRESLEGIMGLDKTYNVAFIGCGRLGQALINYIYNIEKGYNIVGLCDNSPELIGTEICGIKVQNKASFKKFTMEGDIDILVITVPTERAGEIIEDLSTGTKVKGVWNFTNIDINIKGIHTVNMHLSDSLYALTYYINHLDE